MKQIKIVLLLLTVALFSVSCSSEISKLKKLADGNDINAQMKLAKIYYDGNEKVQQDYKEAFKYYSIAAENNNKDAQLEMVWMLFRGQGTDRDFKKAVELFGSHPEGFYDAILMDMRMPEMDGLEATRAIRAMDRTDAKDIPIIALTANAFDEDVQRSMQAGLNAHLSKPIQPELLFETLENLIKT